MLSSVCADRAPCSPPFHTCSECKTVYFSSLNFGSPQICGTISKEHRPLSVLIRVWECFLSHHFFFINPSKCQFYRECRGGGCTLVTAISSPSRRLWFSHPIGYICLLCFYAVWNMTNMHTGLYSIHTRSLAVRLVGLKKCHASYPRLMYLYQLPVTCL